MCDQIIVSLYRRDRLSNKFMKRMNNVKSVLYTQYTPSSLFVKLQFYFTIVLLQT